MAIATYEFLGSPAWGMCFGWGIDNSGTPDSYNKAWRTADSWTKSTAAQWIGQTYTPPDGTYGTYAVYRGGFCWLVDAGYPGPANPTITEAQVAVMLKADESVTDFDLQLCRCDWSACYPCDLWTAENVYDLTVAAATEVDILNTAGKALETFYYSPDFPNLAYINAMTFNIGDKLFWGFRSKEDYIESAPTDFERIQIYVGVAGKRAKLKIWYEEEVAVRTGRGYVIG